MAVGYFDVQVERRNGGALVTLVGDVDIDTAPVVESCFNQLVDEGHRRLVVNLADVELLDSSGISALLHGYRAARENGGSLRLESPSRQVRRVLEVAGVTNVLGL